jgi:hypothetical protein
MGFLQINPAANLSAKNNPDMLQLPHRCVLKLVSLALEVVVSVTHDLSA